MPNQVVMHTLPATGKPMWDAPAAVDARECLHAGWSMDGDAPSPVCAPTRILVPDIGTGIAGGDWDALFNAVKNSS